MLIPISSISACSLPKYDVYRELLSLYCNKQIYMFELYPIPFFELCKYLFTIEGGSLGFDTHPEFN